MSGFYNNNLQKDFNLIKKLEQQHKQLEEKVKSKKNDSKKFQSHPKRLHSDSDTTASNSPRVLIFSSSASNVELGHPIYQQRKQNAENLRKKLHEKLSIIDRSQSDRTDCSDVGDNYRVTSRGRYQYHRINSACATPGGSSTDVEGDIYGNSLHYVLTNNNGNRKKFDTRTGNDSAPSKNKVGSPFLNKGINSSVFEKKFKAVVEKSLQSLTDIRSTITNGIPPPDGDENESRRVVRSKEFSNRFSRNYLYPLARQLKELTSVNQLNPLITNQKILSPYQTILHALQAYQSHLPTSIGDGSFNQLKILMSHVVELCGVHRTHVNEEDKEYVVEFIDTLKINAELTTQKVDEHLNKPPPSTDSILKSENTKISLTKYSQNNERLSADVRKTSAKSGRKTGTDKRFSMYTVTASFRKDAPWKRAAENLAKQKFNVKSKYKTATYKHRPPIQKDPEIISVPKLKQLFPRKSGILRTTRFNSPVNEDHIKTMVEMEDNGEKEDWEKMEKNKEEIKNEANSNKEEILIKLLQFTLKSHNNQETKDDDQSKVEEILNLVKQEPNAEFLKKVLDGLEHTGGKDGTDYKDNQQLILEIVKSQSSLTDGGENSKESTKRKEPTVTVTGEKNARLICITDENSIADPSSEMGDRQNRTCQTEKEMPAKIVIRTSSETQTDIHSKVAVKSTQKGKTSATIKISRLKRSGRNIQPLDKKYALNVIQYKLDFYRHCKNNPMYKRTSSCQPWVLMGKISEDILDQSFLGVAREIEVNDIAERVYQSELKL